MKRVIGLWSQRSSAPGHGAQHLLHGIARRTGRLRLARGLLDFSADGMFHTPIPRTPVTKLVTTPMKIPSNALSWDVIACA